MKVCGKRDVLVPECSDCSELEERVEAVEECCDDAHDEIDTLSTDKADKDYVDDSIETVNQTIVDVADTLGERIDNIITSSEPSVTTLWEGVMESIGDSANLSEDVNDFDYLDIYYRTSVDESEGYYNTVRIPADQFANYTITVGGTLSPLGESPNIKQYLTQVSFVDDTATIDNIREWFWNGSQSSDASDDMQAETGVTIYRIDGVKEAGGNSEIADARVGVDGTVYPSLGDAIRGQIQDTRDMIPQLVKTVQGNPIVIDDAFGEVKNLDVELTPVQDGTPSQDSTVYNEPYLSKTSPSFNSEYDKIVGGTVAWNQWVRHREYTSGGITVEELSDGTMSMSGTNTSGATQYLSFMYSYDKKANHVYIGLVAIVSGSLPNDRIIWKNIVAISGDVGKTVVNGRADMIKKSTDADGTCYFFTVVPNGESIDVKIRSIIVDLTQMFGSTIADYIYGLETATPGAGVAWFKKLFPKDYYAYNAGELMSVKTSAHQMVGFNAYNPTTGTAQLVGGIQYQITGTYTALSLDGETITPNASGYFTPSANGTLTVTGGNSTDTCVHIVWDGERDGDYEAYKKWTYPLDSDLELRGIPKLDASNNLYYDGDTYESDGTVTKKYGIVDMGTLTWNYQSDYNRHSSLITGIANPMKLPNAADIPNVIISSGKYKVTSSNDGYANRATQTAFAIDETGYIRIYNDGTADGTAYKTAMSGVYMVYELATPTTETVTGFTSPQAVGSTESYTDTRAVPIPVGHETRYADIYPISGYDNVNITDSNGTDTTTKTVTLPHTVYGADVDVTGGASKETWQNIASYNGETISEPWLSSMDEYVQGATPTTGAQVTYKLATPTDLTTTPTDITLYNGDNVISSDGDMELSYVQDMAIVIRKIEAQL